MTDDKLRAALRDWFDQHRPLEWTEEQHRQNPTVNMARGTEHALARAYLAASAPDEGRVQARIEDAIADISEEWAESAEWLARMIVTNMQDTNPRDAGLRVDNPHPLAASATDEPPCRGKSDDRWLCETHPGGMFSGQYSGGGRCSLAASAPDEGEFIGSAILTVPAAPVALDVERLREAWKRHNDGGECTIDCLDRIISEYAALSERP